MYVEIFTSSSFRVQGGRRCIVCGGNGDVGVVEAILGGARCVRRVTTVNRVTAGDKRRYETRTGARRTTAQHFQPRTGEVEAGSGDW